ncbi:FkbM family methyltransferase [Segetibacter aerophilus]|uniref:Methyltransferase FkbM domain-containing protein n=1 Tax=Segetibacter aerophilus TaxID=670293 RepID=A0A512BJR1_9BACT|nr:FkbM family methyltransferase [Segetibacter aerophilus]GEO12125.1 hypothetical protein SAE01_46210 [Segetibacter aerophilus]
MARLRQLIKDQIFSSLKRYRQRKFEKDQKDLEEKLLPLRINFYRQFLKEGDLVFDVGANVGNRVRAFLECGAKVVAIEPQPSCVEILKTNFGNKIQIENVGLSEDIGELEMLISNDSTISTFSEDFAKRTKNRFKFSRWERTIKVPVLTLETLIKKYGNPRFCKIDVEGFELQVLKGLKSKIPLMSIEYCVPEMQEQNLECLNYLNTLSPAAVYNYSIGESMRLELQEWKNYEEFTDIVKTTSFINTSFGDIYIKTQL